MPPPSSIPAFWRARLLRPRPGRLRRILTMLAAVPIAGALLDAAENALQLSMMLSGATDQLARIAFTISNAKWVAVYVGLALLLGALLARSAGTPAAAC